MSRCIFALAILFVIAQAAHGDDFSEQRVAIGKKNGVAYSLAAISPNPVASSTPEDTVNGNMAGLSAALYAMLFGKDRSVLEAQAGMTDLLEGESDFYWGGFRVWSSQPEWKDGAFQIAAGLPTVSMRAPLVRLPVGPVTLSVDAGISAEADITAKIAPQISVPIQFTSVKGTLEPNVSASGFLEGYAQWLILRAGIGGELQLVRSDAKISAQVSFGAAPPKYAFEGFISLLAGKIYGFVDYFNVFGWKWKRALAPVFANWKGKCITLSQTLGGANPCATAVP
jgi:hypothetical protein